MTFQNLKKTVSINTINYFFKTVDLYLKVLFQSPKFLANCNAVGIKLLPPATHDVNGDIVFFSPGGFFFFNYYNDVDYDWNN